MVRFLAAASSAGIGRGGGEGSTEGAAGMRKDQSCFGRNLFWALVAIVVGNVLGMLLTALHAWQGLRLVGSGVASLLYLAGAKRFGGAQRGLPAAAGSAS